MKLEEAIKECKEQISYNDIEGNPLLSAYFRDAIQSLIDIVRGQEGTIKSQRQTIDSAIGKAEDYKNAYYKQISCCEHLETQIMDAIKILGGNTES